MDLLIALVEIDGAAGLIAIAVFVFVFLLIAALAWVIVRSASGGSDTKTATWRFSANLPLRVSPATFDRVADVAAKAASRPSLTAQERRSLDGLAATRKTLARGYRLGLIAAGIGGLVLALLIYRDAGSDEMILLPVGIIVLLSLGALLSGLIPSRTVDPIDPIDPQLFRNVHVDIGRQPLTVQLDDTTRRNAIELLKGGSSPEAVARTVTPGYDQLDETTRQQVIRAIAALRG